MNISEQEAKKRRAQRAEQILKDDLIKQAFSVMRESCYNTIETSKHSEQEVREDAYMFMRCLNAFKASFEIIIREGITTFEIPSDVRQLKR